MRLAPVMDAMDLSDAPTSIFEHLDRLILSSEQRSASHFDANNEGYFSSFQLQQLLEADRHMPNQLELLVATYKFYLSLGDTDKAEEMVFQTLIKAALLGGFSHIWKKLTRQCADWSKPIGPTRVFLHSLKVLAIIRIRQKDFRDAKEIFSVICHLDPHNPLNAQAITSRLNTCSTPENGRSSGKDEIFTDNWSERLEA